MIGPFNHYENWDIDLKTFFESFDKKFLPG